MRALSYAIALVLLVTTSSLAGSTDTGMPGVGTFSYNGSSAITRAPAVMAAIAVSH